ncbi:baseplate tail tube cap [Synechococcus phage DSL-LC02]|nr:baseplate tail tube cap [Synechococcus phage DSL-LC02]
MAQQPSKKYTINVPNAGVSGSVTITYESNDSNSSVGKVTKVTLDDLELNPSSSQASTILANDNTKSAYRTSLKSTNPDYFTRVGGISTTPAYASNAAQVYAQTQTSETTKTTIDPPQTSPSLPSSTQQSDVNAPSTTNAAATVYYYPVDIRTEIQDYIQISAFDYEPPNQSLNPFSNSQTNSNPGGLGSKFADITQGDLRNRAKSGKGTVILPMPQQTASVSAANWGEATLNPIDAAKISVAGDVLTGQLRDLFKNAVSTANPETAQYLTSATISRALTGGNVDVNQLLARTTGYISNPNGELLFTGPRLRGFNFTFRLIPRSRDEAKMIRRIVRFFKSTMSAPRSTLLLKSPCLYFIEYKRQSGNGVVKALNKFKPCALTEFQVDNGLGNLWNSYYDAVDDGQPLMTTIQMSFQETTPVFQENYNEFTDQDDIGY